MSRARVVSMIVAVLLSLFLVYAGAVKVLFLAGDQSTSRGEGVQFPYAVAAVVEVGLGVLLLVRGSRSLAAWTTAWAFAGVGVASIGHAILVGAHVPCNCLGATSRVNVAVILDGIIVLVAATVFLLDSSAHPMRTTD